MSTDDEAQPDEVPVEEEEEEVMVESIKVLVRIRPLIATETENAQRDSTAIIEAKNEKEVVIRGTEARHQLRCGFDLVFGPESTQTRVYEEVADCAAQVAKGYNATILAYGQTGSGKSYSMFGPSGWDGESQGIIPRAVAGLFGLLEGKPQVTVYASFVQIYREQIYDMLRDPRRSAPLEIHEEEGENTTTFVSGLSEYAVRSARDCLALVVAGEENRAVRETQMNTASSRSHSIFTLLVEQRSVDENGERTVRAKFNMVDLAGSEKWDLRQNMVEDRVAEMTRINLSLHTLGKCISALSKISKLQRKNEPEKAALVHVPYRESKLTRLLQDSLGGNSLTRLIANLSPARDCVEESVSTLRFADRARSVVVSVRRNEERPIDHALVRRLRSEVKRLKAILAGIAPGVDAENLLSQVQDLRAENARLRGGLSDDEVKPPQRREDDLSLPSLAPSPSGRKQPKRNRMPFDDLQTRLDVALRRNAVLEASFEDIAGITTAFFRFEFEEDELKRRIDAVVTQVRSSRPVAISSSSSSEAAETKPPPPRRSNNDDEGEEDDDHTIEDGPEEDDDDDDETASVPSVVKAKSPKNKNPPAAAAAKAPIKAAVRPSSPLTSSSTSKKADPRQAMLMSAALAAAGPKYRVRTLGSTNRSGGTGWIDPEIEQAEALKRELRETKKRMKKHAQMKEWLLQKNEREAELVRREEEARDLERAQIQERDAKFRRHAVQQKRKLEQYYAKLKEDQLHGASIFSPETDDDDDDDRSYLSSQYDRVVQLRRDDPLPPSALSDPRDDERPDAAMSPRQKKQFIPQKPPHPSAALDADTPLPIAVAEPEPQQPQEQPKKRDIRFF